MKALQLEKIYTSEGRVKFLGGFTKDNLIDFFKSYANSTETHLVPTHSIKFFIEKCLGYYVPANMICDVLLSLGYLPLKKSGDYMEWQWQMKFHDIYRFNNGKEYPSGTIILDNQNHII